MCKGRDLAGSLQKASRTFLLDHADKKKPDVPDAVWHGIDCWVLDISGYGWKISDDGLLAQGWLVANKHT